MAVGCRWVGPALDTSGYASATRSYIRALAKRTDIDLTVGSVSFEQQHTSHGKAEKEIAPLIGRSTPFDIQVLHLTPENYPGILQRGSKAKYSIGYTAWETSRLPVEWVPLCNLMDEIWVPSVWNREVFAQSGVTKPIHVIPHIIEEPDVSDALPGGLKVSPETYVFYSIFQWLERKNPIGLLKAYLTEFKPGEDVCLAIKSYRLNTSPGEREIIKRDINNLKSALNLKAYPTIWFFGDLFPAENMKGFHQRGNCFVLPQRGEGFGLPIAEAMAYEKPVITTGYGGCLDFVNDCTGLLVRYQETPVCNMIFPNYHGGMVWAEPDIMDLRQKMRWCFEHQQAAKDLGREAKKSVLTQLSPERIGDLMAQRLKQISEGLHG